MRHLNYHHLQYFWTVAREGSISKAAEVLNLTPQTISGQLKLLDEAVGDPLFDRVGRRLVLSEKGHVVFDYADEIFAIGAELASVVRGHQPGKPTVFTIGVVNSLPKLIAERIIAPALVAGNVRLRCVEDTLDNLLGSLATHRLDLVLSEQPFVAGLGLKAYNHKLGESGLSFFALRSMARPYVNNFPDCLEDAPMLMPSPNSALRRRLDDWLETMGIAPFIVGEIDDSALLKAFGEAGAGLFVAPSVIEHEVCRMYRTRVIGRVDSIREGYYAISSERRIKHESVALITSTARDELFGG
ncbi:MAG: transcriptional activator NhaR [Gammaproteobacteria bacterium]